MQPLNIPGLTNGWKVDDKIWRSAQPDDSAWSAIAKAGVQAVIDLNNSTTEDITHQMDLIIPFGMKYWHLDWSGVIPPSLSQMGQALTIADSTPGPILVHCQHGSDRTGAFCASWRIHHDKWKLPQAIDEAFFAEGLQGMHEIWMTAAVLEYAKSVGAA